LITALKHLLNSALVIPFYSATPRAFKSARLAFIVSS
jgi:hypothetical protein